MDWYRALGQTFQSEQYLRPRSWSPVTDIMLHVLPCYNGLSSSFKLQGLVCTPHADLRSQAVPDHHAHACSRTATKDNHASFMSLLCTNDRAFTPLLAPVGRPPLRLRVKPCLTTSLHLQNCQLLQTWSWGRTVIARLARLRCKENWLTNSMPTSQVGGVCMRQSSRSALISSINGVFLA